MIRRRPASGVDRPQLSAPRLEQMSWIISTRNKDSPARPSRHIPVTSSRRPSTAEPPHPPRRLVSRRSGSRRTIAVCCHHRHGPPSTWVLGHGSLGLSPAVMTTKRRRSHQHTGSPHSPPQMPHPEDASPYRIPPSHWPRPRRQDPRRHKSGGPAYRGLRDEVTAAGRLGSGRPAVCVACAAFSFPSCERRRRARGVAGKHVGGAWSAVAPIRARPSRLSPLCAGPSRRA
ncbi:hypothetical protein BGZ61DRAFT_124599 [Ilyonectria robusta]|uniref:uncharacterized protein n=1 Tax=Ilyonectria robusta TaxID=1079257 RepID=UPI001E8CF148|nr:uncharacterized protein BGZ61DRAFT_124599 [Ilyonectria robusta]KAH8734431.1 hypothetical protein BGZ61DRAFT_124599 [Ilyonectria robusta]